jgi:hypothetical protein
MGQGAEDADGFFEGMAEREELRRLMFGPRVVVVTQGDTPPEEWYTKQNFPKEPHYMLYQNVLKANGMSTEDRQKLTFVRMQQAADAKVGEEIECCGCGRKVVKSSYQQKYCREKIHGRSNCKDFVNNWISPARQKRAKIWMEKNAIGELINDVIQAENGSKPVETSPKRTREQVLQEMQDVTERLAELQEELKSL